MLLTCCHSNKVLTRNSYQSVSFILDTSDTKHPLFFLVTSLDLSGMLQGKIQVGYSTTAENAAARKAFLVSVTLLLVSKSVYLDCHATLLSHCDK